MITCWKCRNEVDESDLLYSVQDSEGDTVHDLSGIDEAQDFMDNNENCEMSGAVCPHCSNFLD